MRFDCADLLDSDNPGLLWVSQDGLVRHANACAVSQMGLVAGQSLYDPDLARAVDGVARRGVPCEVMAMGAYCEDGRSFKELRCRVIPGTAPDDVFVVIGSVNTVQHSAASDQLMHAVQRDLSEPLRRFQTALSRCQEQAGSHPIEALLGRLEELTCAMGKVLDLASLYRGGEGGGSESISAWQLVQQAWNQEQAKAIHRDVKARFHARNAATLLAEVKGHPADLHRAMVECMDAAISSAPAGSTLDIEHRLDASGLQIAFLDCQAFAAADPSVPSPVCDTPSAPVGPLAKPVTRLGTRELIGYNYCRHVLDQHGGRLRTVHRDGVRQLIIELPTVNAGSVVQSSCERAAPQLHARNLACLMTEAGDRSAKCEEGQPWSPECSAFSSSKTSPTYAN